MSRIALLLCLLPLVNVIDKVPEEEALDLIDADSLPDDVSPADALKLIQTEMIPKRNELKAKTVKELRRIVKEDFGIGGYSKKKEDELVEFILKISLEEAARHEILTKEDEAKPSRIEAKKVITEASEAEKAKPAAKTPEPTPTPKPTPKPKKRTKTMRDIRIRDIDAIEVLKQFEVPTIVTRGKRRSPSSSPVARSIYRDGMARHVFEIAKNRDTKEPGFLASHIKILKIAD